jgi:hypothetical protein
MIPSCMIGQILQHIFTTSSGAKIEDLCQFRPRSIRRGVVFNFAKLFLDLVYKKRNGEFFFWFSSVGLVIIYSHCPICTEKFLKLICKDKLILRFSLQEKKWRVFFLVFKCRASIHLFSLSYLYREVPKALGTYEDAKKRITSIKMARSTTTLVIYRTRPTTLHATADEARSIYQTTSPHPSQHH